MSLTISPREEGRSCDQTRTTGDKKHTPTPSDKAPTGGHTEQAVMTLKDPMANGIGMMTKFHKGCATAMLSIRKGEKMGEM